MKNERVLDLFPGSEQHNRLVLARVDDAQGDHRYILRQETFSSDVGWFVQSRIAIEPDQLSGLKAALTCGRTRTGDARPTGRVSKFTLRVAEAS